ncbi:cytochrome c-type biogenesis protein [Stappia sp. WLB 29]|uniref:cytochrome c-type biogenesis protein n=1 Tax=Stappia sp. WLB 29 TaxID=2925220 RepID=UPI0020BF1119|nr:cytochrome c-type biogenesis protein [Stappia sp. WLB 29]
MMRVLRRLILALAMLAAALPAAHAVAPDEVLDDPVLEHRARELSAELRCMVCQNQSIDDSDAPLAKDLRILVRERLVAGDTNAEVVDFLVARYGEFVLLKPRLSLQTVALWGLAPLALLIGIVVLFLGARRRRGAAPVAASGATRLSGEEQAELDRILSRDKQA